LVPAASEASDLGTNPTPSAQFTLFLDRYACIWFV
jgi:hypothetical protein